MITPLASVPLHAGAAALCLLWALVLLFGVRGRLALLPALLCAVTALWAGLIAWMPWAALNSGIALVEVARGAVALALLITLSLRLGGAGAARMAWRFGLVGALLVVLAAISVMPWAWLRALGDPGVLTRLAMALLVALIAENIARNADEAARWHATLPCIALGGMAAFDLLLYANAVTSGAFSANLLNARAALWGMAPALLVLAALRDRRWRRAPSVSREVVFHGATLLVAGAFLFGVGAAGEALRLLNSDWGAAAQVALLAGGVMALAVALSSRSFRSQIRRRLVDHFFAARYDYRTEWLRCVTVLSAPDREAPVATRAIRAVADAVDVPGGVLLRRPAGLAVLDAVKLEWAESWNLPRRPLSAGPGHPLLAALGDGKRILELDRAPLDEVAAAYGPLWLAVPLVHHREGLVGAVLLARPRAAFPLDDEVRELLRTLGREVAMFLAEREAAERLADNRRLADYAKRFAFVAHDVKTVSNQLSLMLANAEEHMEDPEFQRDLVTTMRASAMRINLLIARLRQEDEEAGPPEAVPVMERLRFLAEGRPRRVEVAQEGGPIPMAAVPAESFDAAVTHLLNNAAEASPPAAPVQVVVRLQDEGLEVDIIDQGPGMSAEFIRDELFRPLATSKPGGSGIGAWQARELLTRAGGSLDVLSRVGEGTTMRVRLPVTDGSVRARA